ncbi:MAG: tyrosine-protein phosphatase [Oscillospiraceae bacterium]|nr:tyrosine-protein phosphatase [Candidatus Limimonas coprohippi]MCQ2488224.1 tyrosine-protein phosphatase [Clostridia bacterium]
MDRFYDIKHAKNTRDFYGLKNKDGLSICTHNFVRSCTLDKLRKADIDKLSNVSLIIDLRDKDETEEKRDKVIPFTEYKNMPLFSKTTAGISLSTKSIEALDHLPNMCDIYHNMALEEDCINHLKSIFNEIIDHDGGVLWHCSEGKDRCGFVSALFLSILDIPYETIMDDYLATNLVPSKNKMRYYKLILFATRDKKKADAILPLFEAREEFLNSSFDAIKDNYGSVDNYLKNALGITDEMKEKLKAKCLK